MFPTSQREASTLSCFSRLSTLNGTTSVPLLVRKDTDVCVLAKQLVSDMPAWSWNLWILLPRVERWLSSRLKWSLWRMLLNQRLSSTGLLILLTFKCASTIDYLNIRTQKTRMRFQEVFSQTLQRTPWMKGRVWLTSIFCQARYMTGTSSNDWDSLVLILTLILVKETLCLTSRLA